MLIFKLLVLLFIIQTCLTFVLMISPRFLIKKAIEKKTHRFILDPVKFLTYHNDEDYERKLKSLFGHYATVKLYRVAYLVFTLYLAVAVFGFLYLVGTVDDFGKSVGLKTILMYHGCFIVYWFIIHIFPTHPMKWIDSYNVKHYILSQSAIASLGHFKATGRYMVTVLNDIATLFRSLWAFQLVQLIVCYYITIKI